MASETFQRSYLLEGQRYECGLIPLISNYSSIVRVFVSQALDYEEWVYPKLLQMC